LILRDWRFPPVIERGVTARDLPADLKDAVYEIVVNVQGFVVRRTGTAWPLQESLGPRPPNSSESGSREPTALYEWQRGVPPPVVTLDGEFLSVRFGAEDCPELELPPLPTH
jgi:hypothetical protein